MSLSADRFQTRGSRLAQLADWDLSNERVLHSRKLGLNVSLQELGLSSTTVNDLIEFYGVNVARSVSRVGHQYLNLYNSEIDVPNLAEVISRFGENYATREIVNKGDEPYDVLVSPKRALDGMILH